MLARKSLLLFVVSMIGSALGFLSTLVIARWMGAAALGTVGYLLGLLGLLGVALDLGFGQAHLKRVSESDQETSAQIGTFLLIKCLLAVTFLILVVLLPWLRRGLGQTLFASSEEQQAYYILAAFYVLHSLATVFLYTFEARLETAKETIPDLGGSVASFVAKAVVASAGLGAVPLSGAYLVEPVVRLLLAGSLFRGYRVGRATRQHLSSYARYAAPLTMNTAINMIVTNVNPVVIRAFWSAREVGYYAAVLGFGLVTDRVASAVMVPFLPKASSDVARGDWEEMRRRVAVAERYMLMVLIPLAVVILYFSADIVGVTLGADFGAAVPVMICLVSNSVLSAMLGPYRMVLYAIERQADLLLSSVVGLGILLAADAVLVPARWGNVPLLGLAGTGAALAMVLMTLGSGAIQLRAVGRHAGIGFFWKTLWFIGAGLGMYGGMAVADGFAPLPLVMRLLLLSCLGLVVYLGILALARQFSRADLQVFLGLLHPQRMLDYVSEELGQQNPPQRGEYP